MSPAFIYLFFYYSYSTYCHRRVITAYLYQNTNVQKLSHADKSHPVHKIYPWSPFADHKFHLLTGLCFWMAGKQLRNEMSNAEKLVPWLYPYILCGEYLEAVFSCWPLHIQGSKVVTKMRVKWTDTVLAWIISTRHWLLQRIKSQIQKQI